MFYIFHKCDYDALFVLSKTAKQRIVSVFAYMYPKLVSTTNHTVNVIVYSKYSLFIVKNVYLFVGVYELIVLSICSMIFSFSALYSIHIV